MWPRSIIRYIEPREYLQFEDLDPVFYVLKILLPQETKQGMKTLLCQSANMSQGETSIA